MISTTEPGGSSPPLTRLPPAALRRALELSNEVARCERLVAEARREIDGLLERSIGAYRLTRYDRTFRAQARAIMCLCAGRWGVTVDQILSRRRPACVIVPRHTAMSLCHDLMPLSLSAIGQIFMRDHGSVIHARTQMANLRDTDPAYRALYDDLRREAMSLIAPKEDTTTSQNPKP